MWAPRGSAHHPPHLPLIGSIHLRLQRPLLLHLHLLLHLQGLRFLGTMVLPPGAQVLLLLAGARAGEGLSMMMLPSDLAIDGLGHSDLL